MPRKSSKTEPVGAVRVEPEPKEVVTLSYITAEDAARTMERLKLAGILAQTTEENGRFTVSYEK
jgi:hypothetical protein